MAGHGGARNRSGPPPDPESRTSDRRGLVLSALPAGGYDGEPPEFPLPAMSQREREVWEQAWRTPQAAAWAREPWRWRTIALWARWTVRMEAPDAPSAIVAQVIRLADQIGLTPAGLKENGWKVAPPEEAPAPQASGAAREQATPRRRSRFRVVSDGDGDAST